MATFRIESTVRVWVGESTSAEKDRVWVGRDRRLTNDWWLQQSATNPDTQPRSTLVRNGCVAVDIQLMDRFR
eukprot:CAMPEP_0194380212 /NCGR_PEP_ID=MMETSP0174-20130528/43498_1 /TAXON_ID=216777 /ORGANISM="Proboscia alata, Strain PI-D3" /LENGTH=71 /DNA_ID=CAMNT_0039163459 /DNA_START=39 /DNA_END=250 /DNA_ORIENTATION=+